MNSVLYLGDMAGFITALTGIDGITSANLWAQITPAAGFIAAMVIFAFGLYIIRKLIKGAGKGKAKI